MPGCARLTLATKRARTSLPLCRGSNSNSPADGELDIPNAPTVVTPLVTWRPRGWKRIIGRMPRPAGLGPWAISERQGGRKSACPAARLRHRELMDRSHYGGRVEPVVEMLPNSRAAAALYASLAWSRTRQEVLSLRSARVLHRLTAEVSAIQPVGLPPH